MNASDNAADMMRKAQEIPLAQPGKARQAYEAETPQWPSHDASDYDLRMAERNAISAAREAIRDEVAMARVLARRGLPLEPAWCAEKDDPRLEAFAEVHAQGLKALINEVREAHEDGDWPRLVAKAEALTVKARAVNATGAVPTPKAF